MWAMDEPLFFFIHILNTGLELTLKRVALNLINSYKRQCRNLSANHITSIRIGFGLGQVTSSLHGWQAG